MFIASNKVPKFYEREENFIIWWNKKRCEINYIADMKTGIELVGSLEESLLTIKLKLINGKSRKSRIIHPDM